MPSSISTDTQGSEKEAGVQAEEPYSTQSPNDHRLLPSQLLPHLCKGYFKDCLLSFHMIKNMEEDFRALPFTAVKLKSYWSRKVMSSILCSLEITAWCRRECKHIQDLWTSPCGLWNGALRLAKFSCNKVLLEAITLTSPHALMGPNTHWIYAEFYSENHVILPVYIIT